MSTDPAGETVAVTVRQAVLADIPQLQQLIRASVLRLQTEDYTAEQRELALERVFGVDTQLIKDGTYFAAEVSAADGEVVIAGCGGWSKRKTLYGSDHCAGREDAVLNPDEDAAKIRAFFVHPDWARRGIGSAILDVCEAAAAAAGFRRLEMGATLTGVPLYRARGYAEGHHHEVPLGPGISLPIIQMEKQLPYGKADATITALR
jgi:N-acetylglutamate synthase-like GNAT family acetyltransferase